MFNRRENEKANRNEIQRMRTITCGGIHKKTHAILRKCANSRNKIQWAKKTIWILWNFFACRCVFRPKWKIKPPSVYLEFHSLRCSPLFYVLCFTSASYVLQKCQHSIPSCIVLFFSREWRENKAEYAPAQYNEHSINIYYDYYLMLSKTALHEINFSLDLFYHRLPTLIQHSQICTLANQQYPVSVTARSIKC